MTEVVTFEQVRRRAYPRSGGVISKGTADFFNRRELREILQAYSCGVMAGDWLDYAVDWNESGAVFAIYGEVSAVPAYTIVKRATGARRAGGRYQLLSRGGVLKTDKSLAGLLRVLLGRKPALVTPG
ncbi:MAG: DUF2794 domain-containing protein [Alphaproteobacteria bacterium]|jgi:hypothetical protein|nr:DUF2794 domain-containing protein [Alphaproteobacteria bacterium]MDP6564228.1 DUF2794 domain-containing protein [Alphaproteobacteria bacterium]MDP6814000.1 DUF2794 domain-containing protein [Alphaproteobacteria bacterium]